MKNAIIGVGLAAAIVWSGAASANTYEEIAQIQRNTPSCEANPGARWVGRVSGSVQSDVDDRIIPVSFVGCFPSQSHCEAWKERTSGFITGPIVQYSCTPR